MAVKFKVNGDNELAEYKELRLAPLPDAAKIPAHKKPKKYEGWRVIEVLNPYWVEAMKRKHNKTREWVERVQQIKPRVVGRYRNESDARAVHKKFQAPTSAQAVIEGSPKYIYYLQRKWPYKHVPVMPRISFNPGASYTAEEVGDGTWVLELRWNQMYAKLSEEDQFRLDVMQAALQMQGMKERDYKPVE